MTKAFYEKRQARVQKKIDELKAKALASESADEVRSINSQLAELDEDMEEIREALKSFEERQMPPAESKVINGNFLGEGKKEEREDVADSMEYRKAFMNYVMRGTAIPAEFRNGDAISTTETSVAIPMTIMNEVINTVRERYGNLYSKVRKMSVKGGVEIPIGSLKASFRWISESTVSARQKLDALGKISFGYYEAEIRIAQTFLSQLLTLSAFEAEITRVIAEAYLEAMDYGIVNGTGNGQMTGILNDPRITNVVTMTSTQISDWKSWRTRFFAKLPLGYRSGEFIFPVSTVDSYLETMSDANDNPIFRQATGLVVNDGDAVNPNGTFFGRAISLVEPDIIPDFDTASAGDVIGIYWSPREYAINENFGFNMMRYFDQETNEWVDKAIVVVDGKVLNPNGFVLIKKA